MKLEDVLNIEKLSGIYLKANVPSYLYEHFRKEESIVELAKYNAEELMGLFKTYIEEDFSFDNLIIIYSLVMALSLKSYREIEGFFKEELSKYQLEWLGELKSICLVKAKATTTLEIDLRKVASWSVKDAS